MYVLLKQEVWWVQHLKSISYLFASASQNLSLFDFWTIKI